MTEDYVSFETAKLLKEKRFPIPSNNFRDWVFCMYDKNGDIQWGCYHPDYYCRVTHQMAMKWLREAHKLFIEIRAGVDGSNIWYDFDIMSLEERAIKPDDTIYELNTYEEAAEAAIKYCLENLIK